MTEQEAITHRTDQSLMDNAIPIPSVSVSNPTDFQTHESRIRQERQSNPSPRLSRAQSRRGNVEDIREQRREILQSSDTREQLLVFLMQQQETLARQHEESMALQRRHFQAHEDRLNRQEIEREERRKEENAIRRLELEAANNAAKAQHLKLKVELARLTSQIQPGQAK